MGAVRVFSRIENPASKYDCSNSFSFRDMTCFMISFNVSENLEFKKFKRFEIRNLLVWLCECTSKSFKIQILRPNATAKMLLVFEI